jgi:ferrous iron transport protein A
MTGPSSLSLYPVGRCGTIVQVDADSDLSARMTALGLSPGRRVRVIRRSPFLGPIQVRTGQTDLIIRRAEADHIQVCPYEPAAPAPEGADTPMHPAPSGKPGVR